MRVKKIDVTASNGYEDADLCSRSGLSKPMPYVTVYTPNFDEVADYYAQLFGKKNVQFRSDDMMSMDTGLGMEIFVQGVGPSSSFAKLKGKQSIGFAVEPRRLSRITKAAGAVEAKAAMKGGVANWDDDVSVAHDPDGNTLHFVVAKP